MAEVTGGFIVSGGDFPVAGAGVCNVFPQLLQNWFLSGLSVPQIPHLKESTFLKHIHFFKS
jgi:hypothetical protein